MMVSKPCPNAKLGQRTPSSNIPPIFIFIPATSMFALVAIWHAQVASFQFRDFQRGAHFPQSLRSISSSEDSVLHLVNWKKSTLPEWQDAFVTNEAGDPAVHRKSIFSIFAHVKLAINKPVKGPSRRGSIKRWIDCDPW